MLLINGITCQKNEEYSGEMRVEVEKKAKSLVAVVEVVQSSGLMEPPEFRNLDMVR